MKRIPAKAGAFFILVFSLSFFVFAIDWPAKEGKLTANFGSGDGGVPFLGNSFTASGSVLPSDMGELIFVHDPENSAARFPSPLGSWMALDHGDNMVGIYARYEDRLDAPAPTMVENNTVLAATGKTGWSKQEGFYFAFFDRKERRWVNPSVLITGNVSGIVDTIPPVIRQVELRTVGGTSVNPAYIQHLPQGIFTIYVDAFDTLEAGGESLAPNRITCSVNGVETAVLSFETLISREGKRMAYRSGLVPASQVYDPKGFGMGEIRLTRGQAVLVIEARDIADNVRAVTYRLTIE